MSHLAANDYTQNFLYYKDSIVVKTSYQGILYTTKYFLNNSGLADSCMNTSNSILSTKTSKSYFSYNQEGYLVSRRDCAYSNNSLTSDFTDNFEYTQGNLTKATPDPNRPGQLYKYVTYAYNSSRNLINLDGFTGPWLGKLNSNLVESSSVGGSITGNDNCSNFEYELNTSGFVETRTITPCGTTASSRTVTTYEYKITGPALQAKNSGHEIRNDKPAR